MLNQLLATRTEKIVEKLQIDVTVDYVSMTGCCPIHRGDNRNALLYYPDGHTKPGHWQCFTRRCEEVFKSTPLGFIQGVLSAQQLGWEKRGDEVLSLVKVLNWVRDNLQIDINDLKIDAIEEEKLRFIRNEKPKPIKTAKQGVSRDKVRSFLKIPSQYYLGRRYSAELLDEFDVGDYPVLGRELSGRAVVPVYDQFGFYACGYSGRAIGKIKPKWLHHQLDSDVSLYGIWKYYDRILKDKVVILVEGPGEVWGIHRAGVPSALGVFGNCVKHGQLSMLEDMGVMGVILAFNKDEAGRIGEEQARELLGRRYMLETVFPPSEDVDYGSAPSEWITENLKPVYDKLVSIFGV